MQADRFYQLLSCLGSSSENLSSELIQKAADELLAFWSAPQSLIFLTDQYKICTDIHAKKGILLGISKAISLNQNHILEMDSLEYFLNNLVQILIAETDDNFSQEIADLFGPVLQITQKTWPTLLNYLHEFPQRTENFFYLTNNIILLKSVEEETIRQDVISNAILLLKTSDYEQWELSAKLSVLSFLYNLIIKFEHHEFLEEFSHFFSLFYVQLLQTKDISKYLNSSLLILDLFNIGLNSSEFSESVCPVLQLIAFCLNNDSVTNSQCIQVREYINQVVKYMNPVIEYTYQLILQTAQLSHKIYSIEIDIQTKGIDDFFPLLKKIPIKERSEFSQSVINELIKQPDPAFFCTALSVYQGALLSNINFDDHALDFFFTIIEGIDDFGVRKIALSTLSEVARIITTEIEMNIDRLIISICTYLQFLAEQLVEIRTDNSPLAVEALQTIIEVTPKLSDDSCRLFFLTSTQYIQNGISLEQHRFLYLLSYLAQESFDCSTQQQTIALFFECLNLPDPDIRLTAYNGIMAIFSRFPQVISVDDLIKAIDNEKDPYCFGTIVGIYGELVHHYHPQVKEYILSKLEFIFSFVNLPETVSIRFFQNYGYAVMTLFYIISAYQAYQLLDRLIQSLTFIIKNDYVNSLNVQPICCGFDAFFALNCDPKVYLPIYQSIKELIETKPNHDSSVYSILVALVQDQQIEDIPNIDFFTISAIMSFIKLVQTNSKENSNFVADIAEFIRLVYENYTSKDIMEIGKVLVKFILNLLANEQSPIYSTTEIQLYYVLSSIVQIEGYFDQEFYLKLVPLLISKINESTDPGRCKVIAFIIKNLCNLNENVIEDQYFHSIITVLASHFVIHGDVSSLSFLNDNIVAALVALQSRYRVLEIDAFFKLIQSYLPCTTDDDEFFDIYASLISFFPFLNLENQGLLADIFVVFLSLPAGGKFLIFLLTQEIGDEDDLKFTKVFQTIFQIIAKHLIEHGKDYFSQLLQTDLALKTFSENYQFMLSKIQSIESNIE